ncbi:transporter [Paenibacillus sp. OV219]|uniref:transporter n=1 Tax=Paenibacillus sp. OV219 TaxID=1884377 RepID=UPI0008C99D40|nr:transporter [Paenibacillus sp. OV219]SEO82111.1 hypothetical protein SAMN05518847_11193 [Paenibacillus sp. OV219]
MPQFGFPQPMRQPPTSPPPAYVPPKPQVSYIIDCILEYTYVWLRNGESFWFYPTMVDINGTTGYRWSGSYWYYYGLDSRFIEASTCPPIPTLF